MSAKGREMFEVHIHGYGRKRITRDCPCQGLLEWPRHTWQKVNRRPVGIARAKAIADEQACHAVVTPWMTAGNVYDNGKEPFVPEGWLPADAKG